MADPVNWHRHRYYSSFMDCRLHAFEDLHFFSCSSFGPRKREYVADKGVNVGGGVPRLPSHVLLSFLTGREDIWRLMVCVLVRTAYLQHPQSGVPGFGRREQPLAADRLGCPRLAIVKSPAGMISLVSEALPELQDCAADKGRSCTSAFISGANAGKPGHTKSPCISVDSRFPKRIPSSVSAIYESWAVCWVRWWLSVGC
jgi:hypothetical protein